MYRPFLLASILCYAAAAHAQTLEGFATLPAETYVKGPNSGIKVVSPLAPFAGEQPIQGFSALAHIKGDEYLALEDNGFGSKANSADFLLRIVRLKIDFRSGKGGKGTVKVKSSLLLRDTHKLLIWPIVGDDRILTGADFDPESMVVMMDGSFWLGEEFGPFLLHFDSKGVLMEAPTGPMGVASLDDPLKRPANISRSRGFEGMAISADKTVLYALLEGAINGQDPLRLPIYRYEIATHQWIGPTFYYPLEPSETGEKTHSIGDMAACGAERFLVNERDDFQGDDAKFKRTYLFDARTGTKTLVADWLNIRDDEGLAGAKGSIYRMPFQCNESVLILDKDHILVCNDNNFPFGKGRGNVENTEFAILKLDSPLF